jgi:hypothetical protein
MTTLGDFLSLAFRPAGQQGAAVPNDGLLDPVLSPIHFWAIELAVDQTRSS